VDLDLENATIAQAASEIARAAGVAIDGLVPASEARVTIRVRKARWWDMLCYVAWEGNFGIEQPAHGLFRLRPKLPHDPKKEVSIHCHHALAPVLFQLLARHGDRNFVIAPDVAGAIVDVELVGASYDAALEAVVDAYGFDVERSQTGILMVTVNPNVKIVRPDASPCDGTVSYGDGIRAKVGALGAVLYDPRELDASEVLMDTEIANSKVAQQRQRHVGDVFECRTDADKDGVHQVGRCKAKLVAIHERSVDFEIDGKESASLEIGK